jgi:hypothetical protein
VDLVLHVLHQEIGMTNSYSTVGNTYLTPTAIDSEGIMVRFGWAQEEDIGCAKDLILS